MLNPFIAAECERLEVAPNTIRTELSPTYSQDGTDLIVEALLWPMLVAAGLKMSDVRYLDIGANHPIQTSNTYLFYRKYRAWGRLIEANFDLIPALITARPRDIIEHAAVSHYPGKTRTLHIAAASELSSLHAKHVRSFADMGAAAEIVREITVPNYRLNEDFLAGVEYHYLSIDIEGEDLPLVSSQEFTECWPKPWIISIEPSEHLGGGQAELMEGAMEDAGYNLVARTAINMIFAHRTKLC